MQIPLFPLGTALLPGGPLPLRVFEPRYLDMVSRCLKEDSGFGVVLLKSGSETGPAEWHSIGTLATIVDWDQLDDGTLGVTALGSARFRIIGHERKPDGLNVAEVEYLPADVRQTVPARYHHLARLVEGVLGELGPHYQFVEPDFEDAGWVGYRLAEILPIGPEQRQLLLEFTDPLDRLSVLDSVLQKLREENEDEE